MKKFITISSFIYLFAMTGQAHALGSLNTVSVSTNTLENSGGQVEAGVTNSGASSGDGDISQAVGQVALQQGFGKEVSVSLSDSKISNLETISAEVNNSGSADQGSSIQQAASQIVAQQSALSSSQIAMSNLTVTNQGSITVSQDNASNAESSSSIQQASGQMIVQQ